LVEYLLHFDWGLLSFDHTESYLCFIISVWLHIFRLKIEMNQKIVLQQHGANQINNMDKPN